MVNWISVFIASIVALIGLSHAQKKRWLRRLCIGVLLIDLLILAFAVLFLFINRFPSNESNYAVGWCFDPLINGCFMVEYSDILTTLGIAIFTNLVLAIVARFI